MAGGVKQVEVNDGNVVSCLKSLVEKYPQLRSKIFEADGSLNKGINLFINGRSVLPAGLNQTVHNGDKIHITYVVLGG